MIYPCKSSDFIKNSNEISSYIIAKKKDQKIDNADRLIRLLSIYYSSMLYYQSNKITKYFVKINGRTYKVSFNGTNENGDPVSIDIIEACDLIVTHIFTHLKGCLSFDKYEKFQMIIISILETDSINLNQKISLLNSDSGILGEINNQFSYQTNENIVYRYVSARINVLYSLFSNKEIQSTISDFESIYKVFHLYIRLYLKSCVFRNHFTEGINFLKNELDRYDSIEEGIILDDNKIVFILLNNLTLFNNLFQLISKEELSDTIDYFSELLDSKNKETIYANLNFNPENLEIGDLNIGTAEPDFSNTNYARITTDIYFVIQLEASFEHHQIEMEGVNIGFRKIKNLFEDPIFHFLDSFDSNINGMPFSIFSDSIGCIDNSYLVEFHINNFYHPEFEIIDDKVIFHEFKLEKAKHGGRYYPHKDFIIEQLFHVVEKMDLPFELEKEKINSNLISNYYLSYNHEGQVLYNHVYSITNFDSYFKTKNKYFEKVNQFEFDGSSDLKDFLLNTEILNHNQFLDFCYTLIEKIIKKAIELGGLHKNLWIKDGGKNIPVCEVDAQRIIFNLIRFVSEMKGISISRECVAANGSVDFYFQYTKNDKLLKVCVELKNAHHAKADEGNSKQLPEYIRDIGYKEGIYIVLWYKGSDFDRPINYSSIIDLEKKLNSSYVKNLKIKNMIIDCSLDKVSPSKK